MTGWEYSRAKRCKKGQIAPFLCRLCAAAAMPIGDRSRKPTARLFRKDEAPGILVDRAGVPGLSRGSASPTAIPVPSKKRLLRGKKIVYFL